MQRIIFLIPYIGKLPWYFPYFLKSCVYNPDIDFKVFSDADIYTSVGQVRHGLVMQMYNTKS
jgi:hypothetical protein